MQKRMTIRLFVIVLTLMLTQLATAQWIDNEFTNETAGDMYVAFTTFRPPAGNIPQGWRTVGWYPIRAGASHTFQAWDENPIYYLIWDEDLDAYLTPDGVDTYKHWESLQAFVHVSEREPNTFANVSAARLLYSDRDRATLVSNTKFFKAENGTAVTVKDDGVFLGGTVDRPGGDDEDDDIPVLDDDGMTVITPGGANGGANGTDPGDSVTIRITSGSGTTLNQGSTSQLTISVTENGDPIAGKTVELSVPSDKATISPDLGRTNSSGQVSATLTVKPTAPPGAFNVTAAIANTDHSTTLPITVEVGAGEISIASSRSSIEPGQTSTITFTVRTPAGDLFPNTQLSLSASVGNINPTLVTTGSNGQATATYRANPYSGAPRPGGVSSPKITATVVDNTSVKAEATLRVTYTVGSVSHDAVSSIESGQYDLITFTVRSQSGTPLSGVRVSVSESDSEIRFNSSSGTTNSSGNWATRLYTKSKGSANFTVSVPGLSSKTHYLTVRPQIWETTRYVKHDSGCRNAGWLSRFHHFDFPGKVVSYTIREEASWSQGSSDYRRKDDYISGTNDFRVVVTYDLFQDNCRHGESWAKIWVDGRYEKTEGSFRGAPSLPSQRYEEDLSLVAAHPQMQLPAENALLPNYPNPFNPETWIPYHLAESADVTLDIYSADGKLVRTLALGHQAAGIYESKSRAAYWDGRNTIGERVASGVYFYVLIADDFTATGKMLIMK